MICLKGTLETIYQVLAGGAFYKFRKMEGLIFFLVDFNLLL